MSKIKRHECKSLREFNKITRKYIKYFRNNYIYSNYWYTWIWVDFIDLEEVKSLLPYAEKLAKNNQPNLKSIINTVITNYNWSFTHRNGNTYYLRGVEISNEDYYYIYITKDGIKMYNSCVGRFTDVEYYSKKSTKHESVLN